MKSGRIVGWGGVGLHGAEYLRGLSRGRMRGKVLDVVMNEALYQ
jgi:hypothetical protein